MTNFVKSENKASNKLLSKSKNSLKSNHTLGNSVFVTCNAKQIFTVLNQAFTKAPILFYFKLN